jgi:hypothetical protein
MVNVYLQADHPQLLRLETERLTQLVPLALAQYDAALAGLASKPETYLQEATLFREAIAAASNEPGASPQEGFANELDQLAAEIDFDSREIKGEIMAQTRRLSGSLSEKLAAVQQMIRGLGSRPTVGQPAFGEMRRSLSELLADHDQLSPAFYLQFAWVNWMTSGETIDAVHYLEQALKLLGGSNGPTAVCTARLLAHVYQLAGDGESALRTSIRASEMRSDALTHAQVAFHALALDRRPLAKKHAELALQACPLVAIDLLCTDHYTGFAQDLLDECVKRQIKARQEARQTATQWESALRKVQEAGRHAGVEIEVPLDQAQGFRRVLAEVDRMNWLDARLNREIAQQSADRLLRAGREAIALEHSKRMDRVSAVKKEMQTAWEAREQSIALALQSQQGTVDHARSAMHMATDEGDKAQKGCVTGAGVGCGILAAYGMVALILGWRGVQIGPTTPAGAGAIILAAVPGFIAFVKHAAYTIRRMALDGRLSASIAAATKGYEEAAKAADVQYRGILDKLREDQKQAESAAQKTSDAMKLLTPSAASLNRNAA